MKGYFRTDIAIESPKYRTELNPKGRKQYLQGEGEIPNDEYPILERYFIPEAKLEFIEPTEIKPEKYKAEKIDLTEEDFEKEKATESPENKMTSSPKKKDK